MQTMPTTLKLKGNEVPINPDFRRWIKFGQLFENPELTPIERQNIALLNTFGCIPEDVREGLEQAVWFYQCGRQPRSEPPCERLLDWEQDWLTIWADFKIWCCMDLDTEKLHWWKFMALFESLPQDAAIKQIISIRGVDLSKIQDPETREDYRRRKEAVALEWHEDSVDEFYGRIR